MTAILQPERRSDATLIIVHGRSFKPRRQELLGICREALAHGLERDFPEVLEEFRRLDLRLAYYGDLTNEFLRSRGESYDESLDLADRRNALAALRLLEKAKQFKMARYDRLPGKTAMKEFAADVSSGLLGALGLADRMIARLAPDVAAYWDSASDYGAAVRGRVRDAVADAIGEGKRICLVTHGTGNIPAWDVLWRLSHDPAEPAALREGKIDSWISLGSPLADESVKRRLSGADRKGREQYPTNVLIWQNLAAEDDYLCHDKEMADDFRAMMGLRLISSIRDHRIYNFAVRYGKSNPHSSVGYLIHPRMAQILAEWLRG